ncbi:MAG: hypothetical protein ACYC3W_02320 [Candidatus Nanopelagicales bacterium]
MNTNRSANSLLVRFSEARTLTRATRGDLRAVAARLGVSETMAIHIAINRLRAHLDPDDAGEFDSVNLRNFLAGGGEIGPIQAPLSPTSRGLEAVFAAAGLAAQEEETNSKTKRPSSRPASEKRSGARKAGSPTGR